MNKDYESISEIEVIKEMIREAIAEIENHRFTSAINILKNSLEEPDKEEIIDVFAKGR